MIVWRFLALLATLSGFLLSFTGLTRKTDTNGFWKSLKPLGWLALSLVFLGVLSGSILILYENKKSKENELKTTNIVETLTGLEEAITQVVQREQQGHISNRPEAQQELSEVKTILQSAIGYQEATIQIDQNDSYCSKHLLFGKPSEDNQYLFCRRGYTLSFNLSTNVADWVTYVVNPKIAARSNIPRPKNFYMDPFLPSGRGPDNRIYARNNYDRGHLIFTSDFSSSPELRKEAYLYSVVAPQIDKMNRGAWLAAEMVSNRAAIEKGLEILVYSGPIFSEKSNRYYRDLVILPVAYFRIMVDIKTLKSIAVIIPNDNDSKTHKRDISSFIVSIDEIEQKTGLDFLNTLDEGIESRIESLVAPKAEF